MKIQPPSTPRLLATLAATLLLALTGICAHAATTFSLSAGWSSTVNPNGPWTYRQGTTVLPLVKAWTAAGSGFPGCNQPAWAPSNTSGDFLPALMNANACSAAYLNGRSNNTQNVLAGDIVIHTVDPYNGNPSLGNSNIFFQLPAGNTGTYQVSGFVWDAALNLGTSRPQDWALLINGVTKASGILPGNLPRSQAQAFNLTVALVPGQTVQLVFNKDAKSNAGYFIGTNMTIAPLPTCKLTDSLTYNPSSQLLSMNFTIGTQSAATWRGWLVDSSGLVPLWSQAFPVTEPAVNKTQTHTLAKSGGVGILSTLTTPTGGITCSSWQTIATGTP